MQRYDLERTAESDREGGTVWVTAMEPDAVGKWVRHADAEAELSALRARVESLQVELDLERAITRGKDERLAILEALRARVTELEAMQKALHLGIASDAGIIRELRERLATLEAPMVVDALGLCGCGRFRRNCDGCGPSCNGTPHASDGKEGGE